MDKVRYIPGDLVMYGSKVTTVRECRGDYYVLNCQKKPLEDVVHHTDLMPIPITPEILDKNEWETQNGWYYFLDVCKEFPASVNIDFYHKSDNEKLIAKVNNEGLVEIEFVHQLQHLLFGLGLPMDLKV